MHIYGDKDYFWQWDTNQKIVLCDHDKVQEGTEVHFSNKSAFGQAHKAIVVQPYRVAGDDDWFADVPDEILQKPYNIVVYISNGDSTEDEHNFTLKPRPKPDDYVYEPTEILKWKALDERIDELEQEIAEIEISGGGTTDHNKLSNRDLENQHPISAITGLEEALQGMVKSINGVLPDENGNVEIQAGGGGVDGKSAYEIAVEQGFEGTEQEWLDSLNGYTPVKGVDYYTDAEKEELIQEVINEIGTVAIDEVPADKVIFQEDLMTTSAIGNITLTNGQATISAAGKSLVDVWETIFIKEKNPSISQPYVSITCDASGDYEVGTEVEVSYSAELKPGNYQYGPATGITAKTWEVADTSGNSSAESTGTFPNVTVKDDTSYSITATATYDDGAIPLTNLKNEYANGQIKGSTKSATAGAITGFRKSFYGTMTEKDAIDSSIIRSLSGQSDGALANGASFDIDIPVGALRVIIAYPATLQDVTSIKDSNGLNAEISSGFTLSTVAVEGANAYEAIDYKVYTMDFAQANDTANTFSVTI